MRIFFKRIFFSLAISISICLVLSLVLDYKLRNSKLFKSNIIFNDKISENIILGSSRSLTGIDTRLLSKITNREWLNLSIDDTPIEIHLLEYKLLVGQNKIPKIVLLQYDYTGKDNSAQKDIYSQDYQFMHYNFQSKIILKEYFLKKNENLGFLFYYCPFWKYFYFNTELLFGGLRSLLQPSYRHRFNEFGDYSYPENISSISKNCDKKYEGELNFYHESFLEFIKLCKIHKTKVIVYTAPYRCKKLVSNNENKDRSFDYINLSNIQLSNTDFVDLDHVSTKGRLKITDTIGKLINEGIQQFE